MDRMKESICLLVPVLLAITVRAAAQNATVASSASAPYPTYENISLEWLVSGDADADGVVSVRYRKQGENAYHQGLSLFRVPAGQNVGFSWSNKHAGSLFHLEAGTTYEIELSLSDPDGGSTVKTLTATTRAWPTIGANARELPVTAASIREVWKQAGPDDVIVLGDGSYPGLVVAKDGAEGHPLVIISKSSGAVIEGDVRVDGRSFVTLQGLTVHGKIKFNDAESIVVRGCTIETSGDGIVSYGSGSKNGYIVGNVIHGATRWQVSALGVDGDNIGEGVQITGPGNVVAWNRVSGFRDCLSLLEDEEANQQVSEDFYGNDLSACADDAIEADFSMGNLRVYQNRIVDSFMGISSQPSLGGPTYFIRNAMYNVVHQAFKLQRGSVGDVGFHNTIIKSGDAFSVNTEEVISRAFFRNNLFFGGPGDEYNGYDSGSGRVMQLASADASCSFDFDGYGSIGTGNYAGRVGATQFSGLAEQRSKTTEVHAVELDLSALAVQLTYPADPFQSYPGPGFTLAPRGAAIDKGTPLVNVNDGFSGSAPDLGAVELGDPEPVYGPTGQSGGTAPASSGGASGVTSGGASSSGASGVTSGGASSSGASSSGASSGGASSSGAPSGGAPSAGGVAGVPSGVGGEQAAAGTRSGGGSNQNGCACRFGSGNTRRVTLSVALIWVVLLSALRLLRRRVTS